MNRASILPCLRIETINNALLHQLLWTRALSALIGHNEMARKLSPLSNLRLQETAIDHKLRINKQPTTIQLNKVIGTNCQFKIVIRSKHHYDIKGIQLLTFQAICLQQKRMIYPFSLISLLKWLNTTIEDQRLIQASQWTTITWMQILNKCTTIRQFPVLMTIQMQWELKSFCSGKLDKAQTSRKRKKKSPTRLADKWRTNLRNRN